MTHTSTALCLALAVTLSGCAWRGTKGALYEVPSRGADLPFSNDGVYVAGAPVPCELYGVPYDPPGVGYVLLKPVMMFDDGGGFTVWTSEEAFRGETPYSVWKGNYRVIGGRVVGRVFVPGGDSGYSRVVSSYELNPTGPGSFFLEMIRYETHIVRYGVYEDRAAGCYRRPFTLQPGDSAGQ